MTLVLLFIGAALVVAGTFLLSPPAALIVLGLTVLVGAADWLRP